MVCCLYIVVCIDLGNKTKTKSLDMALISRVHKTKQKNRNEIMTYFFGRPIKTFFWNNIHILCFKTIEIKKNVFVIIYKSLVILQTLIRSKSPNFILIVQECSTVGLLFCLSERLASTSCNACNAL